MSLGGWELLLAAATLVAVLAVGIPTLKASRQAVSESRKQARIGALSTILGTIQEIGLLFAQQGLGSAPLGSTVQGSANITERNRLRLRLMAEMAPALGDSSQIPGAALLAMASPTEWTEDLIKDAAAEAAQVIREISGPRGRRSQATGR
ncbi:MAG TPA: hypothetical protein VMW80_00010 [Candidatus Dormibacteraeota bacterium]|nr:hypothetical protein [Candidatus Dormibacteraeota bacterium]